MPVSKPIGAQRGDPCPWQQPAGAAIGRPERQHRATDQRVHWNKPHPSEGGGKAAIGAVVAIVPHHEERSRWNDHRCKIIGRTDIALIENNKAASIWQGLAEGGIGASQVRPSRGRSNRPARAIWREWYRAARKRTARDWPTVENNLSSPRRDAVAGQSDHPFDHVSAGRATKHGNITALRQSTEHSSLDRRKTEQKARAPVSVRPFGNKQIVPDIKPGKHRTGRNTEGSHDQASKEPREHRKHKQGAKNAP